MRGRFITIEGVEGAGKSTMIERMVAWLEAHGHRIVQTREPGGTPLAEQMREMLLDHASDGLDERAELLLVFAARAVHLAKVIRPALERGETVLCDRFTDATWAYQGGGRQLPIGAISSLEQFVHGDLQPDLTVLLDLPVEQGLRRAARRSESDRFESESSAFFERVRSAYLSRAAAHPERFAVIDASGPVEDVWAELTRILEQRLAA